MWWRCAGGRPGERGESSTTRSERTTRRSAPPSRLVGGGVCTAGIAGRTVGSVDEIAVQDVPTDGSTAWFPMADGSAVIGKRWTPDGNILTMRYVAEATDQQPAADPVAQLDSKVTEVLSILRSFTGGEQ